MPLLTTIGVFLVGLALGALANWAIYQLAWNPREISPWGPLPKGITARRPTDRIPLIGWIGLRRERTILGRHFWIRPFLVELLFGIGLVFLFQWEVDERGLVLGQLQDLLRANGAFALVALHGAISTNAVWPAFAAHALLITFMAAASFIDIDEKIIPDEITVPGTLLGLVLAAAFPMSLLPVVSFPDVPPAIGQALNLQQIAPGVTGYVEPLLLSSPNGWPGMLKPAPEWRSLLLGQACWWLWCCALTPRFWRGRRGVFFAMKLISRRVVRELTRGPLGVIAWVGALTVAGVWWWGHAAWMGLLTALVGMAVSGGLVWVVRIVGSAALAREAMGFGDVTLMMMVGTFIGWQAGVIVFFVAPFAGLIGGLLQLVLKNDDQIPYGPFLCLGTLFVLVRWADVWNHTVFFFLLGWLAPAVLLVCMVLLGVILSIWQMIKRKLF